MDTVNRHMTMKTVTDTFAAWKAVHDEIRGLETEYKRALEAHAAGDAPFPGELKAHMESLREKSDRLLLKAQHALLKIKTPRASDGRGDSTWT